MTTICPVCGVVIDKFGRCNCNSRRRSIVRAAGVALIAAALFFVPASANDWCDLHPDAPECQATPEPEIVVIGPACMSWAEWSCYPHQMFLAEIQS